MRIYFVRHGESTTNSMEVNYAQDAALTEKGKKQAVITRERVLQLPIDSIISSSYLRARETTEIINQKVQKPVEYSDLFIERIKPSELVGLSTKDPHYVQVLDALDEHASDISWHYSDEENFYDLRARANKALDFISKKESEHLLVVTHGIFMRLLFGVILLKDEFNSAHYLRLRSVMQTTNTGITVFDLLSPDAEHPDPRWKLITWNDYAHLG